MEDNGLFVRPASPDVQVPSELRQPKKTDRKGKVTYTRWRPMASRLCDDCTELIHQQGASVAPPPRRATWRRSRDGRVRVLCTLHKEARVGRGR